jgi:hypothetical protein
MLSNSWPTIGYENSPITHIDCRLGPARASNSKTGRASAASMAMVGGAPDLLLIAFFAVLLGTHGMYDLHTRIHSIFFFWVAPWTWTEDDMHIYILVVVDWK